VALAILVWVFLKTNSVTSQQAFLLAAFLLVAATSRMVIRRRSMIHVLVFVLVGAPFAVLFLGAGAALITALGRSSTLSGRTDIWEKVVPLVPNPLLGAGFESFWLGKRLETMQGGLAFPLNEAHNGFLETYINLGWIGVLLLVLLLIIGYRNIIACYRRDPEAGAFRLALFVGVFVASYTEATFRAGGLSWFCVLVVSMAIPSEVWRSSAQEELVDGELTRDDAEPHDESSEEPVAPRLLCAALPGH
jgi:exopolysaccharide production protein ExoQ